jgi:hypothetical protein
MSMAARVEAVPPKVKFSRRELRQHDSLDPAAMTTTRNVEHLGRRNVFLVPSDSNPFRINVVVKKRGGSICSCEGFAFNKRCWHVRVVDGR